MDDIVLKSYDWDKKETVIEGNLSVYKLAKSMTPKNFADLLSDFCNSYNCEYRNGVKVGEMLRDTHRTLQGTIVRYFLGIIVGLSHQTYTDARNEKAVACGQKIEGMIKSDVDAPDHLDIGYMI